jgi:predicted metalloprotease with PDZ domain
MKYREVRFFILSLVFWMSVLSGSSAFAGTEKLSLNYTIKAANVEARLFHVTTEIGNIKAPYLELTLPNWMPGMPVTVYYAKNILRFKITDKNGQPVTFRITRKQTWRVETKGIDQIKVEFDYRANVFASNQAMMGNDFALINGVQMFLLPEGYRKNPSTIRFVVPEGWKVISSLKETSDPSIFTAPDYDVVADATTELGKFDVTRFDVDGKPHYFVATPQGWFSKEKTDDYVKILREIVDVQSAIFNDKPYDKYLFMFFFIQRDIRPEYNMPPTAEFFNSQIALVTPDENATPAMMLPHANHNYFHVWNLERMRPAEMWPYDYSNETGTSLLWLADGFTTYYMSVTRLRTKHGTRDDFFMRLLEPINSTERSEGRQFMSPADASVLNSVAFGQGLALGISSTYAGHIIAALLDLSIRHDTGGVASLDEVMRALYRESYLKGRGYTTADVVRVVNRIAKRDYSDFFRRYVSTTEVPAYNKILGYAGYRLDKVNQKRPVLGFSIARSDAGPQVARVFANTGAEKSGLASGDLLLKMDDLNLSGDGIFKMVDSLPAKIGQTVKFSVRRGDAPKTIEMVVGYSEEMIYKIFDVTDVTPAQTKLRDEWLMPGVRKF